MFEGSSFNGDISKWDLSMAFFTENMLKDSQHEKEYGTNGEKFVEMLDKEWE